MEERRCRGGCPRQESLSHIQQGCPVTHYERIRRHNEIVSKICKHARKKGWTTEVEPRVYHQDGQLFIPELAIFLPADTLLICDAQVCWEGPRSLDQSWPNKRLIYDHLKFREAAARKWPKKEVLLGARGIWARCNRPTEETLNIPPSVKASCAHTCEMGINDSLEFYGSHLAQKRKDRPDHHLLTTPPPP